MFLLSVFCGVWTLLALTGSLEHQSKQEEETQPAEEAVAQGARPSIYGSNITLPSLLQIGTFLIALALTVWFGVDSLGTESTTPIQPTR